MNPYRLTTFDAWDFAPTFLIVSYAMWGRKIAKELRSK